MLCEELMSLFDLFDLLRSSPEELEQFLEVVMRAGVEMDEEVLRDLTEAEVYTKDPTDLNRTTLEGLQFVSPIYLATVVFVVGAVLSYQGLRS